jgi:catechol 2,3-dioxygenase-like lactoylglutathione lyase family enzyme
MKETSFSLGAVTTTVVNTVTLRIHEGFLMNSNFRFDCLFYYVSDLGRSVDFYSQILGFRLISRDAIARFTIDGVLFELIPSNDLSLFTGNGNARLTLAVDDIDAARVNLMANHVDVSEVRRVSNGLLAAFTDPDGNEIVVWQYA